MTNRHTLAVLVENKPGVLTRVAALFARRAFNIKSLTVGETEHPEISRMTIIVDADSAPIEQVVKQLNKLINVLKVVELEPEDSVERRLLMMKVQADETRRTSVLQIVDLFRAHVVDVQPESVVIESIGPYPSWRRCCGPWSPTASPNSSSRAPWLSAAGRARSRIN